MSVPFSNTHLRVPPGFGTILEGLTREILRDQPADIPKYAAQYFEALLKQREENGVDPAEWAAKMEDRIVNNQAFKSAEADPEKEPATEATNENSDESQTEEESSHSAEASDLSTTQPNVSENVDLAGSTGEENHDVTEKHIILTDNRLSDNESVNRLPAADIQPDDLSVTEEEKDLTITTCDQVDRAVNEKDSSSVPNQDIPQSEVEPTDLLSFKGISDVDVCAQELATAEDEGGDKQETAVIDKEIVEEEKSEAEEPVEVFPFSGLSDVNVCAAELGGSERTIEGAQDDTYVVEEKTSKPQPKETVAISLPQSETQTGNQQEAEDQADKTKEEEERETDSSSGAIHETLAHIEGGLDGNVTPKEESLVEISFEDVPEPQQIKESEEKWTEEGGSVEVLQTKILEKQQEEESKETTAVATDQNISGAQNCDEPDMGVEKEVNSEGQEMESQHELSYILTDKVDEIDTNLNDSDDDDEKGEGVKNISSSHLPTTQADEENPEDESSHKNEDNEEVSELHQNEDSKEETKSEDFKFEEEEITDAAGDREDKHAEGYDELEDKQVNKSDGENQSSQVSQSDVSTAAMEAESETFEARAQHVPEENEESQGTLVDSRPEDTAVEKEVTSKETTSEGEGLVEVAKIDFDAQKRSDAGFEEDSISTSPSADRPAADHQGEERPHASETDSMKPEGESGDKQEECSRPQEEEDIMDIPLDDPEANRAAAKIQAGFRGHMTRKKMKPEDKAEGEERQEDRGQ